MIRLFYANIPVNVIHEDEKNYKMVRTGEDVCKVRIKDKYIETNTIIAPKNSVYLKKVIEQDKKEKRKIKSRGKNYGKNNTQQFRNQKF